MNKVIIAFICLLFGSTSHGQNIGIGVNNPQYKLHIDRSMLTTNMFLNENLLHSSNKLLFEYSTAKNGFVFVNSPSLFVSDNGNVGINSYNPLYKLDIDGSLRSSILISEIGFSYGESPGTSVFEYDLNTDLISLGNNAITTKENGNVTLSATTDGSSHEIYTNLIVDNETKIGGGTKFSDLIKIQVLKNPIQIEKNSSKYIEFNVPNCKPGASVIISPGRDLPLAVYIGEAHVHTTGIVKVKFINEYYTTINTAKMTFDIAIIQ